MSFRNGAIAAVCVIVGVPVTAHAQWTETDLNPAGATYSIANVALGTQQVGYATLGGSQVAGLWNGTASSFVNLNPAGASSSQAFGASGAQQAGDAKFGSQTVAVVWTYTAAPEPAPIAALGVGALGLMLRKRRNR